MGKSSEEKHTTIGGIAGIIYQFHVFLYHLLTMNPEEVVSFEKLDDAAKETPHYISLYQAKHSVKCGVDGETVPLTNRAQDFWKAVDVWMDLIKNNGEEKRTTEEQKEGFKMYKHAFEQEHGEMAAEINVKPKAVKRRNSSKMNVMKIGKDFEVKVLKSSARLEKVEEESGDKYYKLYYKED